MKARSANAYATEYSGNTANAARYGFVESNTGTITDAYWYAATGSGATPVTDGSGSTATQLPDATTAAALSSYTGFDPAIWGQGQAGFPVLRNIMVYIYTDNYGPFRLTAPHHIIRPEPVAGMGLTGRRRDRPVDSTFTVALDNGYVDAGTQAASAVLSSSVYTNIKGVVMVNPAAADRHHLGHKRRGQGLRRHHHSHPEQRSRRDRDSRPGGRPDPEHQLHGSGLLRQERRHGQNRFPRLYAPPAPPRRATTRFLPMRPRPRQASLRRRSPPPSRQTTKFMTARRPLRPTYQLPGVVAGDNVSRVHQRRLRRPERGHRTRRSPSPGYPSPGRSRQLHADKAPLLQTTADITPRPLQHHGYKTADGSTTSPRAA